jgi:hypothetical protein
MFTFSTEDLRPQDRFDYGEVRGKSLFGVTIELERERRADRDVLPGFSFGLWHDAGRCAGCIFQRVSVVTAMPQDGKFRLSRG